MFLLYAFDYQIAYGSTLRSWFRANDPGAKDAFEAQQILNQYQ